MMINKEARMARAVGIFELMGLELAVHNTNIATGRDIFESNFFGVGERGCETYLTIQIALSASPTKTIRISANVVPCGKFDEF